MKKTKKPDEALKKYQQWIDNRKVVVLAISLKEARQKFNLLTKRK